MTKTAVIVADATVLKNIDGAPLGESLRVDLSFQICRVFLLQALTLFSEDGKFEPMAEKLRQKI